MRRSTFPINKRARHEFVRLIVAALFSRVPGQRPKRIEGISQSPHFRGGLSVVIGGSVAPIATVLCARPVVVVVVAEGRWRRADGERRRGRGDPGPPGGGTRLSCGDGRRAGGRLGSSADAASRRLLGRRRRSPPRPRRPERRPARGESSRGRLSEGQGFCSPRRREPPHGPRREIPPRRRASTLAPRAHLKVQGR